MAETKKRMTFTQAMMEVFGKKSPTQTTMELVAEFKALTEQDRAWFKAELASLGYEII